MAAERLLPCSPLQYGPQELIQWSFKNKLLVTGTPLQVGGWQARRGSPLMRLWLRVLTALRTSWPAIPTRTGLCQPASTLDACCLWNNQTTTPAFSQNNIKELWALLHFLHPEKFPDW